MELIELSSYTENEKVHIAREHLIAKQMERNGLKEGQLSISPRALEQLIHSYTREAGVRQLERKLGEVCRKAAREILEHDKKTVKLTEGNLEKYLGKARYIYDRANETDEVGIVRGLAWTSVGGDTLQIEVNIMPGRGEISLTGQLGDVMKESARTGLSYIRSVSGDYGIGKKFFRGARHSYPYTGGGRPQGRALCRHYHGDGHAVGHHGNPGLRFGGHDRRDHPAGPGASHRRPEGENPGGEKRGDQDRDCAREKQARRGGHLSGDQKGPAYRLRGADEGRIGGSLS